MKVISVRIPDKEYDRIYKLFEDMSYESSERAWFLRQSLLTGVGFMIYHMLVEKGSDDNG